jgi:hypothetical protein
VAVSYEPFVFNYITPPFFDFFFLSKAASFFLLKRLRRKSEAKKTALKKAGHGRELIKDLDGI